VYQRLLRSTFFTVQYLQFRVLILSHSACRCLRTSRYSASYTISNLNFPGSLSFSSRESFIIFLDPNYQLKARASSIMDSEDPRSPTSELRRFRLSKPGSQPLDTSLSPQPSSSGVSKLGADRRSAAIITAASDHPNSEHHVEQLCVRSDVSQHQPKDNRLPTPAEQQSIASMIQSVLPVQPGWTSDSPETVNRNNTHYSNSTISYSTDWTPLEPEDFENELKAHMDVANRESTSPQTTTAPLSQGSSSDEPQSRVRVPKRASKESLQAKQAHHINDVSFGSFATASIISSRFHTQRGSQGNGEVNATRVNHPLRDLFPFAKARLDNMIYTPPKSVGGDKRSPENLRRQMLKIVFGWGQDIEELIRDECEFIDMLDWKECF
jgi:hypothetical protein